MSKKSEEELRQEEENIMYFKVQHLLEAASGPRSSSSAGIAYELKVEIVRKFPDITFARQHLLCRLW